MTTDLRIFDFLDRSARLFPDRQAIMDNSQWYSYSYLKKFSDSLARVLQEQGIYPGERVLMLCRNSMDYIVSYFGVLKSGAVVVPVPIDINSKELGRIALDCAPSAIILQFEFIPLLNEIFNGQRTAGPLKICINRTGQIDDVLSAVDLFESPAGSGIIPAENIRADDLALIIYTSGSTGTPKGVCLTHKNVSSNVEDICHYLDLTENDKMMQILPFYYSYGKSFLHALIKSGGSIIINNNLTYYNLILEQIESEGCTGFAGVPSHFHILMNYSSMYKYDLSCLRFVTQAGGPMHVKYRKELRESLPTRTRLFIMYGQTEATARLTYLDPEKFFEKIESVGKPLLSVTIDIRDSSGNSCPLNEVGEIWACGPNIMSGYWNNEAKTEKVLADGYLKTGDIGYLDNDGFLFITGRLKKIVKVGGVRVNISEVESEILDHDNITEVFAMGVPDDILGEAIKVLVVLDKGKDIDDVIRYASRKLPKFKLPKYFILVDRIPRRTSGKIDFNTIRRLHHAVGQ